MDNKKISNLLRAVADLMDQTTEVVVETQKEIVKNVEKTQEETRKASEDFLAHSLKLMKRIEDNDAVRAYQNKLGKQNKNLADALKEIQKMREKAISDMIEDTKKIKTPMDLVEKTMDNFDKASNQINEEVKIIQSAMNL
jgi:gas vesicle protein